MQETEVIADQPNDEYHATAAIGSSGLKLLKQSPLHYWARYLDPDRERDEPTPAMKLGSAVHTAVLEPAEFDARYVVMPEGIDGRSKDGKALIAEIKASGKETITAKDMKLIAGMQNAAYTHPRMRVLFAMPQRIIEQSMYWTDPETGVRCKMRPDFMLPPDTPGFPHGLLMDLKSTTDAGPDFARQVWNLDMLIQAAWYTDGFMQVYGTTEAPPFRWFAQEKEPPYANKPYKAGADLIEYGRREYRKLLAIYAECLSTNEWPGYGIDSGDLELPGYAKRVVDNELNDESLEITYAAE